MHDISQFTGIQCENYYDCSYKETSIYLLHIFPTSSHLYKKGEPGSTKLPPDVHSLCFNQVLAPPFAFSHTYIKALCKATCIIILDDADEEVCVVKQG